MTTLAGCRCEDRLAPDFEERCPEEGLPYQFEGTPVVLCDRHRADTQAWYGPLEPIR